MGKNFYRTLFSERAKEMQAQAGSRSAYARMELGAPGEPDLIGASEADFIAARDSFYMSTITENGWPYIQHRGGPAGFVQVLADNRLAFADYDGNRQYISVSNLEQSDRVALFLMDYPNRRRLKLIGHARSVAIDEVPEIVRFLQAVEYRGVPERGIVIQVTGFDWNCPQHITPRFTREQIEERIRPLRTEVETLQAEVTRLKAALRSKGEESGD
jgi:uncharacterized protein